MADATTANNMNLSRTSLESATAAHLEAYVAHNIGRDVARSADLLAPHEAGFALAMAFLPQGDNPEVIRACTLTSATVHGAGPDLVLPPDAVPHHPLLTPWVGLTLGDMVGPMLLAGASQTWMAPGAPTYHTLDLIEGGGAFCAAAVMSFQLNGAAVQVVANYGPDTRPAMAKILRVMGTSLLQVGAAARQITLTSTSPTNQFLAQASEQMASVAIH
jgi:hypothetical protein